MSKNDGGPAFPVPLPNVEAPPDEAYAIRKRCEGMTLRQWYAGQALAGWLAGIAGQDWMDEYRPNTEAWSQHQSAVGEACVGYADATLNALAARQPASEDADLRGELEAAGADEARDQREDFCHRFAQRLVRRLGESDPDEVTLDGQDRLRGTEAEAHFVVSANDLEALVCNTLSDEFFDGTIRLNDADPTPDLQAELEASDRIEDRLRAALEIAESERDTALDEVERLRKGIEGEAQVQAHCLHDGTAKRLRALLEGGPA